MSPPQPCPYFCCSAFRHFQDPIAEPDLRIDLTNEILPIFDAARFSSADGDFDRKIIEPSLQLASRFLSMDTLYQYILTIAEGDVYLEKPGKSRRGKRARTENLILDCTKTHALLVYTKPTHKVVNERLRSKARELLTDLGPMVDFDFCDTDAHTAGACSPRLDPLSQDLAQKFPLGCRSQVSLGIEYLRELKTAHRHGESTESVRWTQFCLAIIICHELGHALTNARFGDKFAEPITNGRWCGESGFDLEASIFGGTVQWTSIVTNPNGPHADEGPQTVNGPMLMEWPSSIVVGDLMNRNSDCRTLTPLPKCTKTFRLNRNFAFDLFDEDFWAEKDRNARSETLRPHGHPSWLLARPEESYRSVVKEPFPDEECFSNSDDEDWDDVPRGIDWASTAELSWEEIAREWEAPDPTYSMDEESTDSSLLQAIEYDEPGLSEYERDCFLEILRRQWGHKFPRDRKYWREMMGEA